MTMITPSYLGETIEYSSLHACRSTLEDPTHSCSVNCGAMTLPSIWLQSPGLRLLFLKYRRIAGPRQRAADVKGSAVRAAG